MATLPHLRPSCTLIKEAFIYCVYLSFIYSFISCCIFSDFSIYSFFMSLFFLY